jgi:hypothetical protein
MGIKSPKVLLADDKQTINAAAFWSLRGYMIVFPKILSVMNSDELSAIFAHELAHLKYKHNVISLFAMISLISTGFYVIPVYHIPAWCFILAASVGILYLGKLFEIHADTVACKVAGGEPFASSMRKLVEAVNIKEKKADIKWLLYLPSTHPPFAYRIVKALKIGGNHHLLDGPDGIIPTLLQYTQPPAVSNPPEHEVLRLNRVAYSETPLLSVKDPFRYPFSYHTLVVTDKTITFLKEGTVINTIQLLPKPLIGRIKTYPSTTISQLQYGYIIIYGSKADIRTLKAVLQQYSPEEHVPRVELD